jgi:exonuclease SbcC
MFGQARRRDEALINTHSNRVEVSLVFLYEGDTYRVRRTSTRGKSNALEFHVMQTVESNAEIPDHTSNTWKSLGGRSLRETQAVIEHTLRLNYETFVNASFFLQNSADQFTRQRPAERKRILSGILGLDIWEIYRGRAAEQRKEAEAEIGALERRLVEINTELSQEPLRKTRLVEAQAELERLSQENAVQSAGLEAVRKVVATATEQRKQVEDLDHHLETANLGLDVLSQRIVARQAERDIYLQIEARAPEIQAAYQSWQGARSELARWDEVVVQFSQYEKRRQEPLLEIEAERARLEQEKQMLLAQHSEIEAEQNEALPIQHELETVCHALQEAEDQLSRRASLEAELQELSQRQADASAENPLLRAEMAELKSRIDRLQAVDSPSCPLCGQELDPTRRKELMAELTTHGTQMGDRYRANRSLLQEGSKLGRGIESQIGKLARAENSLRTYTRTLDRLNDRLAIMTRRKANWEETGARRLTEIDATLKTETFAPQARSHLAEIDAELKHIGYDAAAHDATRRLAGDCQAEEETRSLAKAQAALVPLEREIADLQDQVITQQAEIHRLEKEQDQAKTDLENVQAQIPDSYQAERKLLDLQEQENRLRIALGAAQQEMAVLDDLKIRCQTLEEEHQRLLHLAGQYKQVERAFGKDGVPAMLIEEILPQIEAKANEILTRLSDGEMTVRFLTQREYKDKQRSDQKETLDILIADHAGVRDYELYSGGEAFRINFAIRLALSEMLAQRAGARLQTLFIDEGFGSQDEKGRQRLLEAIDLIRPDFAKILVITHIDELKTHFPARIEVEKTAMGSAVTVVA